MVAYTQTLTRCVSGITDRDTFTALVNRRQTKFRINAIDTPEKESALR
jgi:endonuclease YncB( thermonuclease family)